LPSGAGRPVFETGVVMARFAHPVQGFIGILPEQKEGLQKRLDKLVEVGININTAIWLFSVFIGE